MGAAAAIPAVLGAGGLLLQKQANDQAAKAAKKATGNQKDSLKRQQALFDQMLAMVQDADKAGQFDPQRQIDQLGKDTEYYSSRDMGNSAAAARTLGYRPGDTAPLKSLRSIDSKYKLQYAQQANQIRTNAFADKLSAYRSVDPSVLNPGIQAYGNQAAQAQSQQGGYGNFFGSIQPFLQAPAKAKVGLIPPDKTNPFWR